MKPRVLFSLAAAWTLLLAVAASASTAEPRLDLLGQASSPAAASRTIVIASDTRHVNVEGGEIVAFRVGEKSFAWHFNGPLSVTVFDLNRVAPAGMLDHRVSAYISPNLDYIGGAGDPGF